MSISRGMNKENVEYYSAIKGNCVIAEMCMDPETVKQSEVSQKEENIVY